MTKLGESDVYTFMMRDVETSDRRQHFEWRNQSHGLVTMPGYIAAGNDVRLLPADLLTDSIRAVDKMWAEHKFGKSC
jgi:hypothetical protein